ncbi:hypothetical protein EV356DRAFT_534415 [Viridothelium virens]|uniref:TPR-like protein n=1 Tax=Viridothelium virens TaxID=1048519 RepID=A0A6A6H587_VIRVR|nr:hypothetical protein EV356DRAFT_534415 [Viridothelium virens]
MLQPRILGTNHNTVVRNLCNSCQLRFFSISIWLNGSDKAPSTRGFFSPQKRAEKEKERRERAQWTSEYRSLQHAVSTTPFLTLVLKAKRCKLLALSPREVQEISHQFSALDKLFDGSIPGEVVNILCDEHKIPISSLVPFAILLLQSSSPARHALSARLLADCSRAGSSDATCLLLSAALRRNRSVASSREFTEFRQHLQKHLDAGDARAHLVQARIHIGSNLAFSNHSEARRSYDRAIDAFRAEREARAARGEPLVAPMEDPLVMRELNCEFYDLTLAAALYERGRLLLYRLRNRGKALADFRDAAELDEPQAHLLVAALPEYCERWGEKWVEHVTKAAASGSKHACGMLMEYYDLKQEDLPSGEGKDGKKVFTKHEKRERDMLAKEWEMVAEIHPSI